MTIIQAVLLGILQGITEFLPISSSGHLVLAETFMSVHIPERDLLGFDVLLHAGTALALLIVYRSIWWRLSTACCRPDKQSRRLLLFIIIATIPAALAGVFFDDFIAASLRNPISVSLALLITAFILLSTYFAKGRTTIFGLSLRQIICIGMVQAFALVPGLSRSGLTTCIGQLVGVKRSDSLDFSFLLAMPIILGATALTIVDVIQGNIVLPSIAISFTGFVSSFCVSLLAVYWLKKFIAKHSLAWFALYLVPVASGVLLFSS